MKFTLQILCILMVVKTSAQVNYFPISEKGKWGAIDRSGKVLLSPKFDYLFPFKNEVSIFKQDNLYGLISSKGIKIKNNQYDHILDLNKQSKGQFLYLLTKDNKQGIINDSGIEITPLLYKTIKIQDSFYFAEKHDKIIDVGIINKEVLFSRKSDSIDLLDDNFYLSYEQNTEVLLDNNGVELVHDSVLKHTTNTKGKIVYFSPTKLMFFNKNYEKRIDTNLVFIGETSELLNFKDSLNNNISYSFYFDQTFVNSNEFILKRYGNYWIINNNDLFGVINNKMEQIVPCEFESINFFEGYFYAINKSKKTAVYDTSFKQLIPPIYKKIVKTVYGFEYILSNKRGALDKNGKKITEARFKVIDQNSVPIKCYLPEKGLVQLIFDENWNYKSKKVFKQMLSLQSKKEILGSITRYSNGSNNNNLSKNTGWYQDTILIEKDGKEKKIIKWGVKNDLDSIIIQPIFRHYRIVNDSISYAYRGSMINKTNKKIKDIPVGSPFFIVNHNTGFITNQTFYNFIISDYTTSNMARGLTKKGIVLINRNLNQVKKDDLHYAFNSSDSMIRYSEINNKNKFSYKTKSIVDLNILVSKIEAWNTIRPFGVRLSEEHREEYFNLIAKTSFTPYISQNIKFGFYSSKNATTIYEAKFDYATDFKAGVSFVGTQDKGKINYGIITKDSIIVPLLYKSVGYFNQTQYDSLYIVKLNNGKKLILDSLLNKRELKLTNIKRVNKNVIIARKKNRFGVLNDDFEWVVEPNYKKIINSETSKLIFKDKKYGILSSSGLEISSPRISKKYIFPLNKGALVYNNRTKKGKVFYFDYKLGELFKPTSGVIYESGNLVLKVNKEKPTYYKNGIELKTNRVFSSTQLFENEKYLITKRRKKTKIIDKITKEKIVRKNLIVQKIAKEGIYFIENNSKGLLNYKGEVLIEPIDFSEINKNEDEFLITVSHIDKQQYKYGILTKLGEQILPCEFLKIEKIFDSVYFCFKKKGESIFLDINGDTIKTLTCNEYHSGEYFLYKTNTRAYFLNAELKPIFEHQFLNAEPFVKGIATVLTNEGWQILNNKGNIISMGCFNSLKSIANNVLIAQEKPKYGVYNYEGKLIIPVEFEQINAISNTIIQVIKEGKVGYITTKGKWVYNPFM